MESSVGVTEVEEDTEAARSEGTEEVATEAEGLVALVATTVEASWAVATLAVEAVAPLRLGLQRW